MQFAILTIMLACASMMYEYCLSHTMTILYGGIVFQYVLTTGFFILFLGLGSLYYEKKIKKNDKIKLYHIEFLLSFFGSISVLLPLLR